MAPKPTSMISVKSQTAHCRVVSWHVRRLPVASLPSLRQDGITIQGAALPVAFLKHADEQTIVALAALAGAMEAHGLQETDFTNWAVIAGPRFFGRSAMAFSLERFAAEGAWGMSPHLIPHRSLHSLSGAVSQALNSHGPNFGVGGGPDAAAEALAVASAFVMEGKTQGVWLLLTGFDPELIPWQATADEPCAQDGDCLAIALALRPVEQSHNGPVLSVSARSSFGLTSQFSLEAFAAALNAGLVSRQWRLGCGGGMAWQVSTAGLELCA